jgi:hypothetical protein
VKKISKRLLHAAVASKPEGYLEDVLAHVRREDDRYVYMEVAAFNSLREKYSPSSGPGTELKKLLKMIGITATPNCQCNQRAKVMDERGCDWCEENIETICEWLREESNKRGMLFVKSVVKLFVRRAISNARAVASKEIANG